VIPKGELQPSPLILVDPRTKEKHTVKTLQPHESIKSLGIFFNANNEATADRDAILTRFVNKRHKLAIADGPIATKIAMSNHDVASMSFYYLQVIHVNEDLFTKINSILSAPIRAAAHLNNAIATEAAHLPPDFLGLNIRNMHAEGPATAAHTAVEILASDPRGILRHAAEATFADRECHIAQKKSMPNRGSRDWPALIQHSSETFEEMGWELNSSKTQIGIASLAQLMPLLRESNKSKRYQFLSRMTGAEASPFMRPQPEYPAKDQNMYLNTIEHAILRGTTEEKQRLTEEITNTPREKLWSQEALAVMQNSKHTIDVAKISEPTIKKLDENLRDMLSKAVNSNQPTRWVAHLPKEMTTAFDAPIYHLGPDSNNHTPTLWKPEGGTIATDGSHMPHTNT
jgi:hypothetical protein